MKLKYEFTVRELMGEYVLIPQGESALHLSGMIITNAVGAFLCEKLHQDMTKELLIHELLEEFEIDEATAYEDVTAFLQNLQSKELLSEES